MVTLSEEKLSNRVDKYIKHHSIAQEDLADEGIYRIVGGVELQMCWGPEKRPELLIVRGRLIDVIGRAVQMDGFYDGWDLSYSDVTAREAGYIEKIGDIEETQHNSSLDRLIA